MTDNPFQAPTVTHPTKSPDSYQGLDEVSVVLRNTRPWVRFISVMMFIASALMFAVAIIGVIMEAAAGQGGRMVTLGMVYVVMALAYAIPASYLWSYADRISLFVMDGTTNSLARALQAQKSFWKFVSVALVVIIFVYAALIVIAAIALPLMRR